MARPKSEQPTKSKILSIRLTEKDYEQLKKDFGSVQKAVEFFIFTNKANKTWWENTLEKLKGVTNEKN